MQGARPELDLAGVRSHIGRSRFAVARTLGVVTNLQRRIPRLGAPSTVYETVGRGASFMAQTIRPLHFIRDLSGETLCGKDRTRVRYTSILANWDEPIIAGGKRCQQCRPMVEIFRASRQTEEG